MPPILTTSFSRSLSLALLVCVFRGAPVALAQSKTSAAYTIAPEVISSAGGTATSASYRQTSTMGGVTGVSQAASDTARQGFAAQLFEISALQVSWAVGLGKGESGLFVGAAYMAELRCG